MSIVLLMERYKLGLLLEYFLVLCISKKKYCICLIYIWVLTWKDLTTPVTRWQCYFRILRTLPRQHKEWDKQGFLVSARLFMWLYREQGFLCLYCPQESVLWYEGIRLMRADRRRQFVEHIHVSICVFCLCRGKKNCTSSRFPRGLFFCN